MFVNENVRSIVKKMQYSNCLLSYKDRSVQFEYIEIISQLYHIILCCKYLIKVLRLNTIQRKIYWSLLSSSAPSSFILQKKGWMHFMRWRFYVCSLSQPIRSVHFHFIHLIINLMSHTYVIRSERISSIYSTSFIYLLLFLSAICYLNRPIEC